MTHQITRRKALKIMGAAAATLTLGFTSLATLTACQRGKKRLVFFFTGTGNSLYAAQRLCGENGQAISIPQALKEETLDFEADEIGIVYPKYGNIPFSVEEFVARAKLKCDYLFAVITYGRSLKNDVANLQELLAEKGMEAAYIGGIKMPDNRLYRFDMAEELRNADLDKIDADLKALRNDIDSRKPFVAKGESGQHLHGGEHPHGDAQNNGAPKPKAPRTAEEMFEINEACIGCGVCAMVCPRGLFSIEDDFAKCEGMCERCLACANACPQLAITPTQGDVNPKARYRNPNVALRQIEKANAQHPLEN